MIAKRLGLLAMTVATLSLGACSNLNTTQQRTLSGGAIGAGTGAVVTAVSGGCVSCGAVVGGAVGAAGGLIYDQMNK